MTQLKHSKTPKIRFHGFSEDWIKKQFNLITSRTSLYCCEENLPRLEYEDIIPESGQLNKDLSKKKSNKKGIKFEKEDVLFGKLRPYLKNWLLAPFDGIAVGDFWVLKPSETVPSFLFRLIQTNMFEVIANQSAGSKMPRSDWNLVSNSFFYISASLLEQRKVGVYFNRLDEIITQYQRRHKKLVTLKQAMLQKMFPQGGANIPEIRFKGFSGDWEEKKLGDICEIVGGGTPSTSIPEYWGGNIDWYSPTEIGSNVYARESVKKITQLGLDKCSAKILPARKTVLFTSRAGIGDMAILKKPGCTNQGFQSLVLNDDIDTYFIYSMGYMLKNYALKHASGSTFLEISSKQLKKMEIRLPKHSEQQKIGAYFRKLDELISQHATQLEKLKQIKSACLAKMFV
ncbi:restriction endonuclease subunit S [Pectobacterium parvum]|uniref:restriction endonuclease subunit S n=1 Tax=Pectobacterium parvum TaxID=2778550 RepID=UPI000DC64931|nr:restriction endonuclease subunit S [Pectobacterium parvum]MCU1801284.1 restriction endonuclease subunit S [Pectobacterium parvum]